MGYAVAAVARVAATETRSPSFTLTIIIGHLWKSRKSPAFEATKRSVPRIHWSHTHDFEIIRGLEALLNSLTFLAPRVGPGMFCWAFRKVEISSTIIPLVKWSGTGKTNFDFANRDKS
jgi:hypothetical protein